MANWLIRRRIGRIIWFINIAFLLARYWALLRVFYRQSLQIEGPAGRIAGKGFRNAAGKTARKDACTELLRMQAPLIAGLRQFAGELFSPSCEGVFADAKRSPIVQISDSKNAG